MSKDECDACPECKGNKKIGIEDCPRCKGTGAALTAPEADAGPSPTGPGGGPIET